MKCSDKAFRHEPRGSGPLLESHMRVKTVFALAALLALAGCATGQKTSAAHAPVADSESGVRDSRSSKPPGNRPRGNNAASADGAATPLRAYDATVLDAIKKRWYGLIDERKDKSRLRPGKVVVRFRQYSDGHVGDLVITQADVRPLLVEFCRRAILETSPYAPWPPEIQRMSPRNYREIEFTFFYER